MSALRTIGLKSTDLLARLAGPVTSRAAGRPGRIPVLCYHRILPEFVEENVPAYSIRPEQFEAQLAYLRAHGYRALTLSEYQAAATGETSVPAKAVLITFDDGFRDNLAVAAPIAERHNMALNLFVCTGLIQGLVQPMNLSGDEAIIRHRARYPRLWDRLSWDELRQMKEAGHGLGFHSHGHRDFSQLDESAARDDIEQGLSFFRREMGFLPASFAFPYGTELSCPPHACEALRKQGFEVLFSTRLAVSRLPAGEPTLPRIMVYEQDSLDVFVLKLTGAYDWLGNARAIYQRRKMAKAQARDTSSAPNRSRERQRPRSE